MCEIRIRSDTTLMSQSPRPLCCSSNLGMYILATPDSEFFSMPTENKTNFTSLFGATNLCKFARKRKKQTHTFATNTPHVHTVCKYVLVHIAAYIHMLHTYDMYCMCYSLHTYMLVHMHTITTTYDHLYTHMDVHIHTYNHKHCKHR